MNLRLTTAPLFFPHVYFCDLFYRFNITVDILIFGQITYLLRKALNYVTYLSNCKAYLV
jgi:hypothetical protein